MFLLLKIPGGGFPRRGGGGDERPGGCLWGIRGGGGAEYFFSGPKFPPRALMDANRQKSGVDSTLLDVNRHAAA